MKNEFKYVDGNAIKIFKEYKSHAIFMHGANCMNKMNAGIARQVRLELNWLKAADRFDSRTSEQKFGSYSSASIIEGSIKKLGINLYTQYLPGKYFDINALTNALRAFKFRHYSKSSKYTIILPKIGSGIGGGDWNEIEKVLKKELEDFNVVVINYKESNKGTKTA